MQLPAAHWGCRSCTSNDQGGRRFGWECHDRVYLESCTNETSHFRPCQSLTLCQLTVKASGPACFAWVFNRPSPFWLRLFPVCLPCVRVWLFFDILTCSIFFIWPGVESQQHDPGSIDSDCLLQDHRWRWETQVLDEQLKLLGHAGGEDHRLRSQWRNSLAERNYGCFYMLLFCS